MFYFNGKAAADILNCSISNVYFLIRTKQLYAKKVGGRWIIGQKQLDYFVKKKQDKFGGCNSVG